MQDKHKRAHAEERVLGNKMSIVAKHGAPEPHISDDSLPGIQHPRLPGIQHPSRMRVKRKVLTGTSATG